VTEERVPDPLTSFISRSLRSEVTDVSEEIVQDTTEAELDRVSFTQDGVRRTLIVKRVPPHASLEVKLLPHLARKTDRVPAVHARGIPPATVPAWPWLLIEDLLGAPAAGDLEAIVRAKVAVERAVAADAPALVALGVLATRSALAAVLLAITTFSVLIGAASITYASSIRFKPLVFAGFVVAVISAGFLSWVDVIRGARMATWDPTPRPSVTHT